MRLKIARLKQCVSRYPTVKNRRLNCQIDVIFLNNKGFWMLLRRVIKHVEEQNWVAITIDFVIVVVGVFIGIQVANWNDERRAYALEDSYLERLSTDLESSIEQFESSLDFATQSREVLQTFIGLLHQAAEDYFTDGMFYADFVPIVTTFDDLRSTGNLSVLRNATLRDALIELHSNFGDFNNSFRLNLDWILPIDSRMIFEFDGLRFDRRTSRLFPEQPIQKTADQIRSQSDKLTRHAAFHYWLKDRAIELFTEAIDSSRAVRNRIEAERDGKEFEG
jgi:hypothetical protein